MKYEIFVGLDNGFKDTIVFRNKNYVDAGAVLSYCLTKCNMKLSDVQGLSRKDDVVKCRQMYCWLFRNLVVKKGFMESTDFSSLKLKKGSVYTPPTNFTGTRSMVKLICKSHCLVLHSIESFEARFATDKLLKKQAYKYLDELDKLIV